LQADASALPHLPFLRQLPLQQSLLPLGHGLDCGLHFGLPQTPFFLRQLPLQQSSSPLGHGSLGGLHVEVASNSSVLQMFPSTSPHFHLPLAFEHRLSEQSTSKPQQYCWPLALQSSAQFKHVSPMSGEQMPSPHPIAQHPPEPKRDVPKTVHRLAMHAVKRQASVEAQSEAVAQQLAIGAKLQDLAPGFEHVSAVHGSPSSQSPSAVQQSAIGLVEHTPALHLPRVHGGAGQSLLAEHENVVVVVDDIEVVVVVVDDIEVVVDSAKSSSPARPMTTVATPSAMDSTRIATSAPAIGPASPASASSLVHDINHRYG
jgi:hypothetical protein